ncbi:MAG: rRNA maturation RNase YbeY [Gemmatimonadota bacterium]|nr:MAG: rRNA maturation RNase YbeY [Gemmatimonadota bacterium]
MAIHIETIHPHLSINTETLNRIGDKVLQDAHRSNWPLSVTFVDDQYIQQLNKTYLDRDYPTDVLAFPIDEITSPHNNQEKILGDIYISLDRAKAQSQEYRVSFDEEVVRLFLHAIFHLLGDSHEEMASKVEHYLRELKTV